MAVRVFELGTTGARLVHTLVEATSSFVTCLAVRASGALGQQFLLAGTDNQGVVVFHALRHQGGKL
jgi:hypothetical protein